jgi:hypothetical protein
MPEQFEKSKWTGQEEPPVSKPEALPLHAILSGKGHHMFKVYSGPPGEKISPLEKDRLLFKEFASLDEAFNWAGHISDTGRAALLIEGDDGTRLSAHEIANALRHREGQRGQARSA